MINIRLGKETDLKILASIYVKAYNPLNIGEHWDEKSAYELLKHLYKAQPDLFFVVEVDGRVAGHISAVVKPWWDGNHLTDGELFIDPKYQREGIGKKLIQHLFKKGLKKYKAVSWDTFTHVVYEHPLKWYKNMGFEVIEDWTMITGDIKKVLSKLK